MPDLDSLWTRHYPEFTRPGDPALQRLRAAARLARLLEGATLFHPGSPCGNFLLVTEGAVRVHLLTASGREVLLYRVRPGGGCILTTACLLGGNAYPAEGIAESPTTALAIPEPEFRDALNQSPFFRSFVFADFAARLSRVIARMEEVIGDGIDARLARAMLAGSATGAVRKTHQALATEIGTAREVVSRHLKQFQEAGWVRLGRGTVAVLDPAALRRLVADAGEGGP
jgi:CRP/FNR family transcriptional regulator